MTTEKATFGAGGFWGVEETFRNLSGVTSTAVGYAGGNKDNPSYEDVCSDETGHAEVVQLEFDPSQISYDQILDVFWSNHNPTTLNRQGPDVGTQYRSVIFYHSPEQKTAAEKSKQRIAESGKFNRPVVTKIEPAPKFWRFGKARPIPLRHLKTWEGPQSPESKLMECRGAKAAPTFFS